MGGHSTDRFTLGFSLSAAMPWTVFYFIFGFCVKGHGLVFGPSWPQDPFERVRLEKWCRTRLTLAP